MTALAKPFGLDAIDTPTASPRTTAIKDGIASGTNVDIYRGMPVKFSTDGVLVPLSSTSDAIAGVFAGCQYIPPGGLSPTRSPFWPANATYVAGTMVAYLWDNPDMQYRIQANGPVAQTAIGDEANLINYTAGNATFGNSTAALNASLVGAGNQGQLRILNLYLDVDNAWGDAYTTVIVEIARHQRRYPQVAV